MIILLGGGSIADTQNINEMIVRLAKEKLNIADRKPIALYLPTAAHESKPAINSFMREFGSRLKCKATCAIWSNGEMSRDYIANKFNKADIIYISGGDYLLLKEQFELMSIRDMILNALNRGAIIVGNSAGAVYLSNRSVSDCMQDLTGSYVIVEGIGVADVNLIPHAEDPERQSYASSVCFANLTRLQSGEFLILE